ncbi:MAG: hypothetical protein M1401_12750 [Chloroflexi bacterium]|nr:hypothetical protein [Chloroflexota bacterium]
MKRETATSKYFFLRPGALGDTLLCAPVLAALRALDQAAWVALAAQPAATALLRDAGLVDLALSQDDPRLASLFGDAGPGESLASLLGPVDYAMGWLADPEGAVSRNLGRLAGVRSAVAPSRPEPGGPHVAQHLASSLRLVGREYAHLPAPPLLFAAAGERAWAAQFLAPALEGGRPLLAVHTGSGSRVKNWPGERFAAVVEAVAREFGVVLISGPADGDVVDGLAQLPPAPLTLARDLTVPRLAGVLVQCRAFLGNDSGVGHLAALLGLPVVSLFGPTDPAIWRPWGERVTVLSWAAGPESLSVADVVATVRQTAAGQ